MGPGQLSQVMTTVSKSVQVLLDYTPHCSPCPPFRDPTKHSKLKDEIEHQSTAYYASARLWDDGIIKPVDTRDTVGLALALAARERNLGGSSGRRSYTTWDGDAKGFGVFRM